MKNVYSDLILDTSGLACPLPALKLKLMLNDMHENDVLFFKSTDLGVSREVQHFVSIYNLSIIESSIVENEVFYRLKLA